MEGRFSHRYSNRCHQSRKDGGVCVDKGHAGPRQRVGALVHQIAGVALDPMPGDVVALRRLASRFHKSSFFTGFLPAVRQPLRFQLCIQEVTPWRTYWKSVCRSTAQGRVSASSAEMAAKSPCDCWWSKPRRPKIPSRRR